MTTLEPETTELTEIGFGRWRAYPEYKNSGIEWLGEIPIHWEKKRLKSTVLSCQNGIWGNESAGDNSDISCIRVADFDRISYRIQNTVEYTKRSIPDKQRENKLLKYGDLLLEKSGGGETQPVGAVMLFDLDIPAVCSNFIAHLEVSKGYSPRFLCYLHAALYLARINTLSIKQSIGIQNLDSTSYLNEKVAIPSLSEQHIIASFLDHEASKIDTLITKKRKLITILQEQRSAIITHAVTKGLDPNVPMKDSGIEWLGDIPEHWKTKRLKFLVSMMGGGTPSKNVDEYWQGSIPWVSPKDMKSDWIENTEDHISEDALDKSATTLIPSGSVLIVVRSGILKHSLPVALNSVPVALNQDMKALNPSRSISAPYLAWLLRGTSKEILTLCHQIGATVDSIRTDYLNNIAFPIPPKTEQSSIAEFLDHETARIDKLISKADETITYLQEYRSALISAAVTGKIDIRGEIVE